MTALSLTGALALPSRRQFEETCACDLNLVGAGDGAALLARVKLEGARSDADVVMGLDTNLTAAAKKRGCLRPHSVSAEYSLPIAWTDDTFAPYDWGYFAFVHNVGDAAPTNFKAWARVTRRSLFRIPRSSTPGLGLLMWVKAAYGAEAARFGPAWRTTSSP